MFKHEQCFPYFSWKLTTYGYHDNRDNSKRNQKAHTPDSQTVKEIMKREFDLSQSANLKRAQSGGKRGQEKFNILTENISKMKLDSSPSGNSNKFDSRGYNIDDLKDSKSRSNVENDDEYIEQIEREIMDILEEMDDSNSEIKTYIKTYLQYKREQRRKKRIHQLISEISEHLEKAL